MRLVSHFKLDGNLHDETGVNQARAENIGFTQGADGRENGAAVLKGEKSWIEIAPSPSLDFGTDDFFLSLSVKLPSNRLSFGDLICKYDPEKRTGFNLTINSTSGGYTGLSDSRNLSFGLDNGSPAIWQDHGRPEPTNTLISSMCVFEGQLYAGIADAAEPEKACRVYRFLGDDQWLDCGRLGSDPGNHSVFALLVHQGRLYASTGAWDWDRAFAGNAAPGRVFCYEGGQNWCDCGQVGTGYRIMAMASHQGELYASSDSSEVYRYLGGSRWEFCGGDRRPLSSDPADIFRLDSLLSDGKNLYGGGRKRIYRYEGGSNWQCLAANPFEVSQVHKLAVYRGKLHAGTWPHGRVLRFEEDGQISNTGDLGVATDKYQINEVNDLAFYNGKFYAGSIPKAELYRYDDDHNWANLGSLLENPAYSPEDIRSWNRIPSLATYAGKLFMSASSCHGRPSLNPLEGEGCVFSISCGNVVSSDRDIGTGWRHIAAARRGDSLIIYLDGQKLAATKLSGQLDLDNDQPLTIGFGQLAYLDAVLDDLVLIKGNTKPALAKDIYNRQVSFLKD